MPRQSALLDHPQLAAIEAAIRADDRSLGDIARELAVPYPQLKRYARRLRGSRRSTVAKPEPGLDAVATFTAAFGKEPTDYQVAVLTDQRSTLVLKSRQSGFTQAGAGLAIATARGKAGADAVIVSPSLQQSKEVTTRARIGLYELEERLVQDATGMLRLTNGSRIISLPGNARAVRGYSPALVVVDEAAWVLDETYAAVRPLLAASGGRLVCQSTAGSKVGWFFELWQSELGDEWLRLEVPASSVPFIDADFLAREQRELAPAVFAAEYLCQFSDGLAGTPLFTDLDDLFVDEASAA